MVHYDGVLPIRKIDTSRVSLSSAYGKTTVSRNDKKVNDYAHWLNSKIMQAGLDPENKLVDNLAPANVFDHEFAAPRIYSIIASSFKSFFGGGFSMVFDHTERKNLFPPEILETYEKDGALLFGFNTNNEYLVIDKNNTIYTVTGSVMHPRGNIETILGINQSNAPTDYAQIKIYGKNIPVGVILGYQYGLEKLMELLKVSPRRVNSGQRQNLLDHEYAISFSDETLIFSKDDRLATLILAGFAEFTKSTKNYSVYTFDKPGVYFNILDASGIGVRYLREIDLMDSLFVDPITEDLLKEMNEPTTFKGLMVRASEMLMVDTHAHPLNMEEMRIKGYERMSTAVYTELINSIREHKGRSGRQHQPIEMHPFAVWKRIDLDPSKQTVSEINPIQDLKEMEAVTYSGTGGRMSRSMTKKSREYHPNDMGVISEATTDSSDVAINTFLSADPQFKSLRGTAKPYVIGKTGATALLSTSALISPSSDKDD